MVGHFCIKFGDSCIVFFRATLARYMLSSCVRLSVCPSVTSQHCTKGAKRRITRTTDQKVQHTVIEANNVRLFTVLIDC